MHDFLSALENFIGDTLGLSAQRASQLILTLETLLVALLVYWIASRIIGRKAKGVDTRYVIRKVLRYTLTIVVTLVLIKIWVWGQAGNLLAGYLSIISAGLAIALHAPLTNLAG